MIKKNDDKRAERSPHRTERRNGQGGRGSKPHFAKKEGRKDFDNEEEPSHKSHFPSREGRERFNTQNRPKSSRHFNDEDYSDNQRESGFKKGRRRAQGRSFSGEKRYNKEHSFRNKEIVQEDFEEREPRQGTEPKEKTVRLNKYIAHAGICSRREADELIAAGSVSVNGKVVTEMGFKVQPGDVVSYGGETLRSEAPRYFLLNKPKGFITTLDDPQERKTVMMLIDGACNERIYPVGRLDRATTGLLLFTNDGELAKKLTHPSSRVYKIYHVEVDRPVTREDMIKMTEGIELEDGMISVDEVQYVEGSNDKRIVGVQLHSGKNRIVRRIFEHLGYNVHKLDRVVFAGLTKKDLPRGRYRELSAKEVAYLKMI